VGLRVLSVAYPQFEVSADANGGAEQVLYLLERGIVNAGCGSLVVAAKGSRVSGQLIETPPQAGKEITETDRKEASRVHLERIQAVLARERIDVIHFHGLDFPTYIPEFDGPKVVTVHLPASWYAGAPFDRSDLTFVCVSEAQAKTFPGEQQPVLIPNGIDVDGFYYNGNARKYLLWLGRICPEKGVHIALRVAHKLDLPLVVAGPVHRFRSHQAYFAEEVQPLLDAKRKWVGTIGLKCKASLLAGAIALLHPSLAPETSSLVSMEAASSGTPVVAFRSGALPEIVEHGVTGFVVDSEGEMAEAVKRVHEISRDVCRKRAVERFSGDRMTRDYLDLYRGLLRA